MLRFAAGVRPYYLNPVPAVPSVLNDSAMKNRAVVARALAVCPGKVIQCRRPREAAPFSGILTFGLHTRRERSGMGEQTYRIDEDVRRAAAAWLCGHETIADMEVQADELELFRQRYSGAP